MIIYDELSLLYHLFEGVCFGRRRRVAVLNRKVSNIVGGLQFLWVFHEYVFFLSGVFQETVYY